VIPQLDAVVLAERPYVDGFPDGRRDTWVDARRRHPGAFADDRWRLAVRCFLLRSSDRTILVDAGVGPETAPAFGWSAIRGSLPEELEAAGVSPTDVDTVVITHVHDDHLGWTVAEGTDRPLFERARHLVHPADWELMASASDPEDGRVFELVLAPIERAWLLELVADRVELTPELTLVHAPGHTPGHQVVLIDSDGARAIVSGDLVNHPAQLLQPGLSGTSDLDPSLAAATRDAFLGRIEREERLVFPAHFPQAAGWFVRDGDRWDWAPEGPGGAIA
jgi:glyoxylase-like metal-dependent hydrolase (beta-lactamase superfamily II)